MFNHTINRQEKIRKNYVNYVVFFEKEGENKPIYTCENHIKV